MENKFYLDKILKISSPYLKKEFNESQLKDFLENIEYLKKNNNTRFVINEFQTCYTKHVKSIFQEEHKYNKKLSKFLEKNNAPKLIWGHCLNVLKGMKSESVHCMVTSPPYYNARDYSNWDNLNDYLAEMRLIIRESYRVLENHRVFVWNVGDVFDNDNLFTKSVWGKRRLPLGAYFIKIFEEEGFTFVDDFIWDKGEVQSERHKNGNKPYPFYQYPMNCYEHILVFHKHRLDLTRYPCPICGCLKVNGNTQSEIGLMTWECKNDECFERSKSNRGKRFSLKTNITQSQGKNKSQIDEDFIKRFRRDIIKIPPVIKINSKGENRLGHTAPYPELIPEFAIKMFSYEGEIVLDPFGGSLTSVIAASKHKRVGIGIELNKKMFRDAIMNNLKKTINLDKIEELDYDK